MIDFKNGAFFKLKKIDNEKAVSLVSALLISDESIISTYKALREFNGIYKGYKFSNDLINLKS